MPCWCSANTCSLFRHAVSPSFDSDIFAPPILIAFTFYPFFFPRRMIRLLSWNGVCVCVQRNSRERAPSNCSWNDKRKRWNNTFFVGDLVFGKIKFIVPCVSFNELDNYTRFVLTISCYIAINMYYLIFILYYII